MSSVSLDFETRSSADLKKVGLHVYAAHPTTSVLCAAYAFGDEEEIYLWHPGMHPPVRLLAHVAAGAEVRAWNAAFEFQIWNNCCRDWPPLKIEQMTCTMVQSYAMGLPGSLEGGAAALGITEQKDMAGGRLMIQMSKPKTEDPLTWWDGDERFARLYEYCRQDVRVERAASKRLLPLSPYEKRVWQLDQRINDRGITVDVEAVKRAIALVDAEKARLDAEMRAITGNRVAACSAVQQIKDFLEFYGVTGDGLDKAAVAGHLSMDLDPVARRVLELRAEAGKAATSKFGPMVASAGADNRVRGCFQYSGANTRRWAGRRIQLHNLKRPTIKNHVVEAIINDISAGASAAEIDMCYGSPMGLLGDCTRSFLTAAPGHELLVADFSAIEARVLAWLSGQENILEVFRNGQDIYKIAAAAIFGAAPDKISDEQRQVGKVAVLALGYGGGVGAFQTMAKSYGVRMEPAYGYLMDVASPEQRARAKEMWAATKIEEISEKEFIASELTKVFWREANPRIVDYWSELEIAAISATLNPGQFFGNGNVRFKKAGSFLWCQLPGGGVICYPYPEVKEVKTPWGTPKQGFTYMAEDGTSRKWMRFTTYGGSLAENITQAVSRDLLADAMLRLDAAGFSIVATVHDEIICEMPIGVAALQNMIAAMTENPKWALSLPLKASGFVSRRYRK